MVEIVIKVISSGNFLFSCAALLLSIFLFVFFVWLFYFYFDIRMTLYIGVCFDCFHICKSLLTLRNFFLLLSWILYSISSGGSRKVLKKIASNRNVLGSVERALRPPTKRNKIWGITKNKREIKVNEWERARGRWMYRWGE